MDDNTPCQVPLTESLHRPSFMSQRPIKTLPLLAGIILAAACIVMSVWAFSIFIS